MNMFNAAAMQAASGLTLKSEAITDSRVWMHSLGQPPISTAE
jgi:hypothetical protein